MAGGGEERDDGESALAIIGMSGRFPGAADVRAFWENLRRGVESIRFFTDEELIAAGESPEALSDPAYVRANGKLDGIDEFDAGFWGMSPRDAAVFDPQHRLFLEVAWEAFEDAGYVPERIDGAVGVFAACGMNEYLMYNLVRNQEAMDRVGPWLLRHTGNDTNFLATRVSYEMNLRGPSMNVQRLLVGAGGVHLAAQSLLSGECDMALAGGRSSPPRTAATSTEREIMAPTVTAARSTRGGRHRVLQRRGRRLLKASRPRAATAIVLAVVRARGQQRRREQAATRPERRGASARRQRGAGRRRVHPEEVSYETHGTGRSSAIHRGQRAHAGVPCRDHKKRYRHRLAQDEHRSRGEAAGVAR